MALGAVDDEVLTERVGRAIGTEARAMGVNVVYAPVLDLATNPANPALGIRAFGDSPAAVARHGAAMVRGLQAAGVAATVKHAPGMGHISSDTHHGLAVVEAARDVLDAREFVPFRAAFAAGARLAMSGHAAVPAVSGRDDLPATLSRAVMTDLLRRDLGFEGVTISDALDMAALAQGPAQVLDVARRGPRRRRPAARGRGPGGAGSDRGHARARGRARAAGSGRGGRHGTSCGRAPGVARVGRAGTGPLGRRLRRAPGARRGAGGPLDHPGPRSGRAAAAADRGGPILAVMPRPADLTPADTSSTVAPGLAAGPARPLRDVDEIVVEQAPDAGLDRGRPRPSIARASAVVVGTIDGHRQPAQIDLVEALAATGTPTVAVALRGPWDVAAYPPVVTALATYSILPGSLDALAAVLAGEAQAPAASPSRSPPRTWPRSDTIAP